MIQDFGVKCLSVGVTAKESVSGDSAFWTLPIRILPWEPTILTVVNSAIILHLGLFLPHPLQFIIPQSFVYFALLTASSNEQLINEVILSFNVAYIP
jgi:hypothetical protein